MAPRSESVLYIVVVYNDIFVLIGLECGYTYCVGLKMVGGQYLLVTADRSDGKAPSVICVELGDHFFSNVHFV